MLTKPLPPQKRLSELLRYDPETGRLFWRLCPTKSAAWNTQYAGNEALTHVSTRGYRCGGIEGQSYKAHRIIWKLEYGVDPEFIDHIDGDSLNNRIENLRSVSHLENMRNQKLHATNISGVPGVFMTEGRWRAAIGSGEFRQWVGSFDTFEEAAAARKNAEREHGYFQGHGR